MRKSYAMGHDACSGLRSLSLTISQETQEKLKASMWRSSPSCKLVVSAGKPETSVKPL